MTVKDSIYSRGKCRVIAIYLLDDNGDIIPETVRYAVIDSNHKIISQYPGLSEAASAMEKLTECGQSN